MSSKSSKKKPVRRPRPRTTNERAYDEAKEKLDKAITERTEALMAIDRLSRQIPWLENLVLALTPLPSDAESGTKYLESLRPYTGYTEPAPAPPMPLRATPPPPPPPLQPPASATPVMDQQTFLQQFMPRPTLTRSATPPLPRQPPDGTSDDPDEFLRDAGSGQELLG